MNQIRHFFPFLLFPTLVFICGCAATYIAGGGKSLDGKFDVSQYIVGQSGHAFNDQTKKTAYIKVFTNDEKHKSLFSNKYKLYGASVSSNFDWSTAEDFTIRFFDYGPHMDSSYARKHSIPKRDILAIHCHYDRIKGRFFEDSRITQPETP